MSINVRKSLIIFSLLTSGSCSLGDNSVSYFGCPWAMPDSFLTKSSDSSFDYYTSTSPSGNLETISFYENRNYTFIGEDFSKDLETVYRGEFKILSYVFSDPDGYIPESRIIDVVHPTGYVQFRGTDLSVVYKIGGACLEK